MDTEEIYLPRKRILIVDDDEAMTSIMAEALSANDTYHVDVTNDPHQAYQWASTYAYDLLIADFQMPSMNGHDLYLCLRGDPDGGSVKVRRPPLLLVSGVVDDNALREFSTFVEGTSWLAKPFDIPTFLMKAAEALWEGRECGRVED